MWNRESGERTSENEWGRDGVCVREREENMIRMVYTIRSWKNSVIFLEVESVGVSNEIIAFSL